MFSAWYSPMFSESFFLTKPTNIERTKVSSKEMVIRIQIEQITKVDKTYLPFRVASVKLLVDFKFILFNTFIAIGSVEDAKSQPKYYQLDLVF